MIYKKLMDPILQSETLFYISDNPDEVIKQARNDHNILLCEDDFQNTRGFFRRLSNSDQGTKEGFTWFVWVKYPDMRLVIHEACELVFDLLSYHNIKYSPETQEMYCLYIEYYANSFLVEMIEKEKRKKKK